MIADLNPYSVYKDSGVPWLGKVPEDWEIERAKWLFRHRKELNAGGRNANVLSLTLRGVVNNDPEDPEGLVPKDYESYQLFAKGDLVFKLIDLENLRTSRVGLVHEDGIMSPAYVRLEPKHNGIQRFFFHQFYDLYQRGVYNKLGAGVRATLGPSDLLNLPILVPQPTVQSAIVRYLDHVDRRIRRYIRAKQKLIKLLEEQKQAIIHRTVMRGLDPNVRFKPSETDYLGNVPEHWRCGRLRQLTTRIGDGLHGTPQYVGESPYHFVNGNNLRSGSIVVGPSTRCVDADEFQKHWIPLDESTLLMSINGTIGSVAYYQGESVILGKSAAYIKCGQALSRDYLFFVLQSKATQEFFKSEVTGTTIFNLSLASIRKLPVPQPPLDEQLEMSSLLARRTDEFNTLSSMAQDEIKLVREYHLRLIADVVTGKLDVREAAARLPEEPEEPEPSPEPETMAEEGQEGSADVELITEEDDSA